MLHFKNGIYQETPLVLKPSMKNTGKIFVLKNGCEILVREIRKEDRLLFLTGFKSLSSESLYHRFNSSSFRLTDKYLDYFTVVDSNSHCALGALDLSKENQPGIAVGRFIRLQQEPDYAELAITVLDEYQRLGIGTILFLELCRVAQSKNIQFFTFSIHAKRRGLFQFLMQKGAVLKSRMGPQIELSFPLSEVGVTRKR